MEVIFIEILSSRNDDSNCDDLVLPFPVTKTYNCCHRISDIKENTYYHALKLNLSSTTTGFVWLRHGQSVYQELFKQ